MKSFKNFILLFFISILGIYIGTYIYNNKKNNTKEVFSYSAKVYLIQYGVYSDIDKMKEAGNSIPEYFYFYDKDGYHIIIGITLNKELSNKIKDAYKIEEIYLKEINISNHEFIENLKQYDNLLRSLNENDSIIEAEKQILSKYEELILKNE